MPFAVVSCRVVSCRVVSCRVVSCRVVSCRVVSCRVVSSSGAWSLLVLTRAGCACAVLPLVLNDAALLALALVWRPLTLLWFGFKWRSNNRYERVLDIVNSAAVVAFSVSILTVAGDNACVRVRVGLRGGRRRRSVRPFVVSLLQPPPFYDSSLSSSTRTSADRCRYCHRR